MPLQVLHAPGEWAKQFGATPAVISVGNFDGVHLGHQKILGGVVELARAAGAIAAAVTFDPHPVKILRPAEAPPLILTLAQRLERFGELGLDAAVVLRFDRELSRISPEEFVQGILVEQLRAKTILVGENFRFGHRHAGDTKLLMALGQQFGFEAEIVPPVLVRGQPVSSTAVRRAVSSGRVGFAGRLLGRPFSLSGTIQPGSGQGSRLVVPTLNLTPQQELVPKIGVYATETIVGGRSYRSATNVGLRPTFDGRRLTIESHLFDFSEQIASGTLEIRFWKRLRDEKRFRGADELRAQIELDLSRTREFFQRLDRSPRARQPT